MRCGLRRVFDVACERLRDSTCASEDPREAPFTLQAGEAVGAFPNIPFERVNGVIADGESPRI